jgi:hypothetical protein
MATALETYSPASRFLDLISKWEYDVPLTTQWFVTITPENESYLMSKLNGRDSSGIYKDNGIILGQKQLDKLYNSTTRGVISDPDASGLFFVQNMKLPKESFSINTASVENMGGYLKSAVGGDRIGMSEKSLSLGFLETNLDFNDGIIKPWIITASYEGLIALSDSSIKATIRVSQYTKAKGFERKPRRKLFEFFGCVPYSISDSELNYDGERIDVKTVEWVFTNYNYTLV